MAKAISKLEHLPNELLLEMFAYCRPRDLYVSLYNLNERINSLISIQILSIDLGNALPKYLLDVYYKSVLPKAHQRIHTLRLSDTYGRMNYFVFNDTTTHIDFELRKNILNQIKHLILWDPMMTSLDKILNYVNNLEYIHITSIGRARQTPNFSNNLLQRLFQMNRLQRVYLALHDSIAFNENICTNTSITDLTLNGCFIQDLAPILRRLPSIQKLNIMCYNRPIFFTHENEFDFSLYDGLADCLPYLTHLTLNITHTALYEIEALLKQLPKLIRLSFSSLLTENYSNGSNWERIITKYLPKLQRFSLFINETHISSRTKIDIDKIIKSFSTLFWYKWPVVVEYFVESENKRHLMLYTLPSQKDNIRTYLYGLQTQTTRDIFYDNKNNSFDEANKLDYKKVYELHFTLNSNVSSNIVLPNRIYTNLKSISFTSDLVDHDTYEADNILADLQKICPVDTFKNIKRIYLYNQIYPTNFLSKLLNLLSNVQSLRVSPSLLQFSTVLNRITSLTLDFTSVTNCNTTDLLCRISKNFPNLRYFYIELDHPQNIYIYLIYFLRKLSHLLDVHITLHQTNERFDQQEFILWLNDYKLLNGLNPRVQVEFSEENNRLHISL